MSHVLLVQGDARHLPLADASVECVVTSPPYYSLRDYQTGQWVGGESGCDHSTPRSRGDDIKPGAKQGTSAGSRPNTLRTCPRCGAVRIDQQIGLEPLHDCQAWARQEPPCAGGCWVCAMRVVFTEVWRVLVPTGVLFVNVGDSYARSGAAPPRRDHSQGQGLGTYGQQGYSAACAMPARGPGPLPEKNLLGLPWRMALALQADGFILRSEIICHKLNPMPESVGDRVVRAHEQIFMFSKQSRYYFDAEAVREPGSLNTHLRFANGGAPRLHGNKWAESHGGSKVNGWALEQVEGRSCRSVWSLASEPCHFAHFATFPTALVRTCLLAGCPRQVCTQCGKPHVRQVERTTFPAVPTGERQRLFQGKASSHRRMRDGILPDGSAYNTTSLGFSPTCACAAPTRPGIALDIFCGSGTTLQVARELGLHGVGVDLSWPYLATIARERLGLAALHKWHEGEAFRHECFTDLPLFAET